MKLLVGFLVGAIVVVAATNIPQPVKDKWVDIIMDFGDKHVGGPFKKGGSDEPATRVIVKDVVNKANPLKAVWDILGPNGESSTAGPDKDDAPPASTTPNINPNPELTSGDGIPSAPPSFPPTLAPAPTSAPAPAPISVPVSKPDSVPAHYTGPNLDPNNINPNPELTSRSASPSSQTTGTPVATPSTSSPAPYTGPNLDPNNINPNPELTSRSASPSSQTTGAPVATPSTSSPAPAPTPAPAPMPAPDPAPPPGIRIYPFGHAGPVISLPPAVAAPPIRPYVEHGGHPDRPEGHNPGGWTGPDHGSDKVSRTS